MKVYLFPGVGADHRLYDKISLPGFDLVFVNWKPIKRGTSLEDYAKIMAEDIDSEQDFCLVGVSMGGMIAIEISKFLNPKKTIIISSAKNRNEFPWHIKFARATMIHYLSWDWLLKQFSLAFRKSLGAQTGSSSDNIKEMLQDTYVGLSARTIAIMKWKSEDIPEKVIHIHGTNDKTLPHKNAGAINDLVEDGTHTMIYDRAEEVSLLIKKYLETSAQL